MRTSFDAPSSHRPARMITLHGGGAVTVTKTLRCINHNKFAEIDTVTPQIETWLAHSPEGGGSPMTGG